MDELVDIARRLLAATRAERQLLGEEGQAHFAALAKWLAEHDKADQTCPGNAAQE